MGRNGEGVECCMCGDHGLSSELFTCIICGFRSQHKYCSNLYPGAESYNHCNWCLNQKGTSSAVNVDDHEMKKSKLIDHSERKSSDHNHHHQSQIKKQNKVPPPPAAGRKRDIVERSNGGGVIKKPVFRNKVRRYKLLEEVISN